MIEKFKELSLNGEELTLKNIFEDFVRPCMAEFVGTCLFVFIGCMAIPHSMAGNLHPALAATPIALSHGLLIASLVISFGKVSGGHFNPAITLGVALSGHITTPLASFYVIMQLTGALLGAVLCKVVEGTSLYTSLNGGAHILPHGITPAQGILCEMLLTTVLVLTVILSTCDERTKSGRAPLGIGFCVLIDILAGIRTSGASMNPARSFGPAVILSADNSEVWTYHYVYWLGPLLGSVFAAIMYRAFLANHNKRLFMKQEVPEVSIQTESKIPNVWLVEMSNDKTVDD